MTTQLRPLQIDQLFTEIVSDACNQNAGLAMVKANKHYPEMTKEKRKEICDRLNEIMLMARREMYGLLNNEMRPA